MTPSETSRCLSSGILLGRLACGSAALGRAIAEKDRFSSSYTVVTAADPMLRALEDLKRALPAARPRIKELDETIRALRASFDICYSPEAIGRAKAALDQGIVSIAKVALHACGKRRPADEHVQKLLRVSRDGQP